MSPERFVKGESERTFQSDSKDFKGLSLARIENTFEMNSRRRGLKHCDANQIRGLAEFWQTTGSKGRYLTAQTKGAIRPFCPTIRIPIAAPAPGSSQVKSFERV